MMEHDDAIEHEKALKFLERKDTIHVSKLGGRFNNGILLEVGSDFFILKDRVTGFETFILFKELARPLELFKNDKIEEEKNGNNSN